MLDMHPMVETVLIGQPEISHYVFAQSVPKKLRSPSVVGYDRGYAYTTTIPDRHQ